MTHSKEQQPTHDVPTYAVENTYGTNKGGDLRLVQKPQTVSRGEKNTAKDPVTQESYCTLINISSTRAREAEKSSYGVD